MAGAALPQLRFTVRAVFMATTCICCYIAGRLHGVIEHQIEERVQFQRTIKIHRVQVSTAVAANGKEYSIALTDVAERVRRGVMPPVWNRPNFPCRISASPANGGLLILADQSVHDAIDSFLRQARDLRLVELAPQRGKDAFEPESE